MFAYLALLASASPTVQLPTLSKLAGRAVVSAPYPTAATNSDVPVIPNQFYATIYGNTTGTVPGVPYGQATVKQWYDYTNKRVREDRDDGTTKMYDYKTLVDPGNGKGAEYTCSSLFLALSLSFRLPPHHTHTHTHTHCAHAYITRTYAVPARACASVS